MTQNNAAIVLGLIVVLGGLADDSHGKPTSIDISPCIESFDAVRRADLLMFERNMRAEQARAKPNVQAISDYEKLIAEAKTMSPVEYAKRNQSSSDEFYKNSSLASLNKLAADLRKDVRSHLVNDVDANRTTKDGGSSDGLVLRAAAGAWDWRTMCVVAARISASLGKPVPQSDQDLLQRIGTSVKTIVQAAEESALAQKSAPAVASIAPATQAKAQVAPTPAAHRQATYVDATATSASDQIKGFVYNNAKDCLTEDPAPLVGLTNSCNYNILVGEKRPGREANASGFEYSGYIINFQPLAPNRSTTKTNLNYVACRNTGGNDTCTESTVIFLQACRRWEKFSSPIWSYIENVVNRFGDGVKPNTSKWNYQAEINKARMEVIKMAINEQTMDDDKSQLACAIRAHSRMRQKLLTINSKYPTSFHVTTPYEYWAN